ncbi:MAG: hypothetical protein Q8K22_12380 [Rhodoferax sp.]|nr:hypothetical protein [Rhodoferax sp.]
MVVALELPDDLVADATRQATAEHRSVSQQMAYWARVGKAVLENPEMPLDMIQAQVQEALRPQEVAPFDWTLSSR